MIDPVILRQQLRETLALAPRRSSGRRSLSEASLKIALERKMGLQPDELPVPDFIKALEWNHVRNFVEFEFDSDAESNFWELTANGRKKEGVK